MEIEKKYLVKELPEDLSSFSSRKLTQSYISRSPVIRLRKIEEPLREAQYEALRKKEEGRVLIKRRYLIPLKDEQGTERTAELDIFEGDFKGLRLVEVEFPSEEEMAAFCPPDWFGEDVSDSAAYHNSTLSGIDR